MKFGTVILVALIFLLVCGCSRVLQEEIDFATSVCKDEGGLNYYHNPITLRDAVLKELLIGDAYCNNGVVISGAQWKANKLARESAN